MSNVSQPATVGGVDIVDEECNDNNNIEGSQMAGRNTLHDSTHTHSVEVRTRLRSLLSRSTFANRGYVRWIVHHGVLSLGGNKRKKMVGEIGGGEILRKMDIDKTNMMMPVLTHFEDQ